MSGSGSDCFNSIRRYAASTPDKLFAVSHRLLSGFLKREPHEDQSNYDNQEWPRPGVEPQQPGRMFERLGVAVPASALRPHQQAAMPGMNRNIRRLIRR
jgi:hypothetical protein